MKRFVQSVLFGASALVCMEGVLFAQSLEELLVEKGVITRAESKQVGSGAPAKTFYKKGTEFEFPDQGFSFRLNTQIQSRYTFFDNDSDTGDKDVSSFDMRRVRLIASGSAMDGEFDYLIQTDFVGTRDSDGVKSPEVRDVYITWNALDWTSFRMGQWKTQISRQENNSSSKLQFADRSFVSDFFNLGRQAGAGAIFANEDKSLTGGLSIFNGLSDGEGRNRSGVDNNHTGIAHIRWNMGKIDPFEEGDISSSDELGLSFGGAYAYNEFSEGGLNFEEHDISVDANMKISGWSAHGEFFWRSVEEDNTDSDEVEPLGFYAQAGYFLVPEKWELAARYAYLDCDDGRAGGTCSGNDQVQEVAATVNYFFWKHALKAQLGYFLLSQDPQDESDDVDDSRWIFQVSTYF